MTKKEKQTICLFTDGSVDPQTNVGYGAYLIIDEDRLSNNILLQDIKTKRFENTSCIVPKLELEALLWAFAEVGLENYIVVIYTDCQNIIGLKDRREKLELANYFSKTNKLLKNHALYKEFYKSIDLTQTEFIKVKGHKKKNDKDAIDKIFTYLILH